MPEKTKNTGYGASSIKQLEGLEAVRKRPGMYIGSTGERGLHHLIWEVVDNAVDEAMAGHATKVEVTLLEDGGVQVVDDGRGIPVEMHEKGIPTVQLVLTSLHAGGKFDSDSYAVSGGLHGVGISVVNALSSKVEVEVERDGYHWYQSYAWNEANHDVDVTQLQQGDPSRRTGTTVRFWADPRVFETTRYEANIITKRLQEMAFLNKGLTISFTDLRPSKTIMPVDIDDNLDTALSVEEEIELESKVESKPKTITYCYPNGLNDFVGYINRTKKPIHEKIIGFNGKGSGHEVEIAMQWNDSYSEAVFTFANTINTHEGGTHEEGFRTALTSVVNKYARDKKLLKDKDENLSGDDVREGLAAVVSVKIADPQFEGQTKTKLGNTEIKSFVQKVCNEQISHWLEAHPNEAKTIINKAVQSAQARIAARKARELVRRKGPTDMAGWTGKLADCRSKDPRSSEIFIVEGDSAGGSARGGRDSMFQAILSIRGKIINVEKARIDRVLKNTEVQSIIGSFGTGIHDEFDLSKLRYYKIILMADADVDGQHISTLLLTLLFRFMKPLVEQGHVYLAQPPLYKLKWLKGADPEYAYSDRERDVLLQAGLEAGKSINTDDGIQRYKGLGEMNAKELWETTMDPTARVLKQITLDDAAAADDIFSVLMGEDVSARKHFITRNANDVRFLDI